MIRSWWRYARVCVRACKCVCVSVVLVLLLCFVHMCRCWKAQRNTHHLLYFTRAVDAHRFSQVGQAIFRHFAWLPLCMLNTMSIRSFFDVKGHILACEHVSISTLPIANSVFISCVFGNDTISNGRTTEPCILHIFAECDCYYNLVSVFAHTATVHSAQHSSAHSTTPSSMEDERAVMVCFRLPCKAHRTWSWSWMCACTTDNNTNKLKLKQQPPKYTQRHTQSHTHGQSESEPNFIWYCTFYIYYQQRSDAVQRSSNSSSIVTVALRISNASEQIADFSR